MLQFYELYNNHINMKYFIFKTRIFFVIFFKSEQSK
jgi:hypothetical protein